ncbi:MAG: MAPEG family protein [Pseudomonadota bacterium]
MIELVPVTALYAGALAILVIYLSFRVAMMRRAGGIGIGDGGNSSLSKAIRVQGNAVEYVPLALVLLLLLELNGAQPAMLHALGGTLVLARVLHAWGLSSTAGVSIGRLYGTMLTWIVILSAGVLNILL